jgi:hypothetical protein
VAELSAPRTAAIAIVVMAATGLAGCGGASSPHVASLPTGTSVATTNSAADASTTPTARSRARTASPKGNPTALLNEWATCMHGHGDPTQSDPTIDANGVITIHLPVAAQQISAGVHAGADPCNRYVAAAQEALRAAHPVASPPGQTEQVKYVNCLRASGVPNYPYPSGNSTNFNGTGVDPTSPLVMNASKVCATKLGLPAWWATGTGPPGDVVVESGPMNGGSAQAGFSPSSAGTGGDGGAGANG